ncbi:phosphatase PAP2 family protein [Carboxylicivirga sp. RSCT41]|uniref:phosphatase PAP2 family protein n=1 Tax=Carboxylicivirga agarovorans TaxID=3417570 RepID=UPI003D337806
MKPCSIYRTVALILLFLLSVIVSGQNKEFPYQLMLEDVVIIALGLSVNYYGDYRMEHQERMTSEELMSLSKDDINCFDRGATNYWNDDLHNMSSVTKGILRTAPSVILINEAFSKEFKNVLTYAVMYYEVLIVTSGFTSLTKSLAMRKRPYLYNTSISFEEREQMIEEGNVYDSFFSGHTSAAFASAVFLSKSYRDIYGNNTLSKVILWTSLSLAVTTGYLRYRSGHHYPTDIIAGAVFGSAVGYLVPTLHLKKKNKSKVSVITSGNMLALVYRF